MKILIIGGRGFLGKTTRKSFERKEIECFSAGRSKENDFHLDLMDSKSISSALNESKPELIVNFAGAFEGKDDKSLTVNSEGPKNLIKAIERTLENSKLIHISSATEPRNPNHLSLFESKYSESKYIGTQNVLNAVNVGQVEAKVVRVHNCYGPEQPSNRFVSWVINQVQSNEGFYLNYPNRIRDFCLVSEAATAIASISTKFVASPSKQIEDVGTGVGISLKDAAFAICDVLKADRGLVKIPDNEKVDMHPSEIAQVSDQGDGFCNTKFKIGITELFERN